MPVGYLLGTVVIACCTAAALAPPQPAHSSPSRPSFWLGYLVNEVPVVVGAWLALSTAQAFAEGDLHGPVAWPALALAAATWLALAVIARRGLRTGDVVARALDEGLGWRWRADLGRPRAALPHRRVVRTLLAPLPLRPRAVERLADIPYGDGDRRQRLDVYRHRSRPTGAPVLVYLHGGGFRSGGKHREARPLLHRLARRGWVCVSADYRLAPAAAYADQLADVHRVLAWVRAHVPEHGGDPTRVVLAGGSAGAHLAATAALTTPDPVAGVVCLYGYYGRPHAGAGHPSRPADVLRADAPPFFVVHGDNDTLVVVDDARRFVRRLRATSRNPVVYAELPGGQHAFDLAASPRCEAVVDGIEAFTAWATRPVTDREPAG